MRLPNGYGSVYKLSGKRRKPYIARKTTGYDDNGKQLYSVIGYYKTRQDALQALAEFNDNPYDLDMAKTTFSDIYEKWCAHEFDDDTNASTRRAYEAAYKRCEALHNKKMSDIKPRDLQKVLDNCELSYESIKKTHQLFKKLYRWCIKNECLKKNYADDLTINVKYDPTPRTAFSSTEINILWKHIENDGIKLILMLIYSGVRISELLDLKKEDVHLKEQWFQIQVSKTKSGIRVVPIADKVLQFWQYFMDKSKCNYAVCNLDGKRLTYENFKKRYWFPLMEQLGMKHTPHECRHTCVSQLTIKNANPTIIKMIVGHKSKMSLTEKVYTHIEIKELIKTINLI